MARFDVYGRLVVEVERSGDSWTAWLVGGDGKRRPAPDVPFPPGLTEDELGRHLEDVFHEHGAPGRTVRRLDQ